MTRASEPMTRKVVVVPPELTLDVAWAIMQRERFRHLPVVRGRMLLGILSDRDVLVRAKLEGGAPRVPAVPVGEAMTPIPCVCQPTTPVVDLVRLMTEQKIDAVPVIGATDEIVGLVTSTDLLLLLITLEEAKAPLPFEFYLEEGAFGSHA